MKKTNKTSIQPATTTSRAIAALVEIMRTTEAPRRRIEACEHLLDYECPTQVIDAAKATLLAIVEDSETLVDVKLEALKLLRRVESRRVQPGRTTSTANIKIRRALEILRRRNALLRAGIIDRPPDYADDLMGDDYVPLPD
jgi:type II secretory pathway predicted ATPase ExeA